MKGIPRLLSLLLCVAMMFALASCGGSGNETSVPESAPAEVEAAVDNAPAPLMAKLVFVSEP